jgi:hypothetical protein
VKLPAFYIAGWRAVKLLRLKTASYPTKHAIKAKAWSLVAAYETLLSLPASEGGYNRKKRPAALGGTASKAVLTAELSEAKGVGFWSLMRLQRLLEHSKAQRSLSGFQGGESDLDFESDTEDDSEDQQFSESAEVVLEPSEDASRSASRSRSRSKSRYKVSRDAFQRLP